ARLLQHATPAELLTDPAVDLVSDVVGADRGIRRLSLTPLRGAVRPLRQVADVDKLPTVPIDGTMYDALAAMLTSDALHVLVEDAGRRVGTVSRSAIFAAGSVSAVAGSR
ncbi:MAG TPA: ABC transporter ATP-binding protein, partial [Actinoplanes sp.]|nr:ABC transporter ATP-binding protein [Actinoplanes sp.]